MVGSAGEANIDFGRNHAELPLVDRKSNWGKKERWRMEQRCFVWAAAELMSIKCRGYG